MISQLNNMDYGQAMQKLLDQTFKQQRYKEMNLALRIFLYIFTWPLFVAMILGVADYCIGYFLFKLCKAPIDYLLGFVHAEADRPTVRHASQFIIYFLAFPTIVSLQIFVTLITVDLFLVYFMTNVFATLWSLGGAEFMPFINSQRERRPAAPAKHPNTTGIIDLLLMIIPNCLFGLIGIILCFALPEPIIGVIVLFALPASWNFLIYLLLGFDKDGTPTRRKYYETHEYVPAAEPEIVKETVTDEPVAKKTKITEKVTQGAKAAAQGVKTVANAVAKEVQKATVTEEPCDADLEWKDIEEFPEYKPEETKAEEPKAEETKEEK